VKKNNIEGWLFVSPLVIWISLIILVPIYIAFELSLFNVKIIGTSGKFVGIDEVQKFLIRSTASVYRYTNTDLRNLNPSFNPRKLNPEFRTDQKDPLKFHPNEVARFAKDILRIKEVTVEVFNTPSSAAQNILVQILEELKSIRSLLEKE